MKIFKKYFKNSKGFTLMELLVTVILVAVLASYSVYYYNNSIDEGKVIAAKGKLAALGGATARFFIEREGADELTCTSKAANAEFRPCNGNTGDNLIYDVFACDYAETSVAYDKYFNIFFGCPSSGGEDCGSDAATLNYTVFMKPDPDNPENNPLPEVFPKCVYYDMEEAKLIEVK